MVGAVFFLMLLSGAPKISAHELSSDGGMHVTLHVEPDDDPVINKPQKLVFIYSDELQKFDAQNCSCTVTISDSLKQVFTGPVPPAASYFGEIPYTFNKAETYRVRLAGEPKTAGAFTPFNVAYEIGVKAKAGATTAPKNPDGSQKIIIGTAAGLVVIGMFGLLAARSKGSRHSSTKNKN